MGDRIRPRPRGFTIIELLVTVAIVGLLASAALPMAQLASKRHKEAELHRALNTIRDALDEFKRAADEGHMIRDPMESGYPATLDILVSGVVDAKSPEGRKLYFLRRIPRDPFFSDDSVTAARTWGKRSYESEPDVPKEGPDVYDIYSLSTGVGLNHVPYSDW